MNRKLLIPGVICLVLCLLCLYIYLRSGSEPDEFYVPDLIETPTDRPESTPEDSGSEPAADEPDAPAEEPEPYVSPIDFDALQAENPDIYAWLLVEGGDISLPVLQCEDDSFYLDHNAQGEYSVRGALFTESEYNDREFDDQITVIYGHNMSSGAMFGNLQSTYGSAEQMEEYSEFVVYLPDRELHYRVFAAVPYDSRHIVYNYGDGTAQSMEEFLFSVSSVRAIDAVIDEEAFAAEEDSIVVLSTCLTGDLSRRFLVVGKLTEAQLN